MAVPASLPDSTPSVAVPHTNRDPVRSLRPTSVIFRWHGQEYEIPALPAADWLEVFMERDWMAEDILIRLLPGGLGTLDDDDLDNLDNLGLDILEAVSARHWWVADRLIQTVANSWDVMGAEAALHQVDPERISLASWLDTMLLLILRYIKPDEAPMFVAKLELPPEGESLAPEEMEMSESQFLSMSE